MIGPVVVFVVVVDFAADFVAVFVVAGVVDVVVIATVIVAGLGTDNEYCFEEYYGIEDVLEIEPPKDEPASHSGNTTEIMVIKN